MQRLHRGIADAALGAVHDALEGQVVVGLVDDAQIGERVAQFQPFVEARSPDHPVGQAQGEEAFLELARLEARAHQDRDVVERDGLPVAALALDVLDPVGDDPRLLLAVPHAAYAHSIAAIGLGPQGLA